MALYKPGQNATINHAIQFATTAHGNQVRKGNEHIPYIFHPIDVANEVILYSGLPKEELLQASLDAILHDTIEDTAVTKENVSDQFGEVTASDVLLLTEDKTLPKVERLQDTLRRLSAGPARTKCVKLGDRTSNLKTFPAMWSREKIKQYLDESVLIAEQLGDASETLKARLLMQIAENRIRLSLFGATS